MDVNGISIYFSMISIASAPDEEEQRIIRRLLAYGIVPTGKKSIDKEKLRRIELEKAKIQDIPDSDFITVTKAEQEKIYKKKKEKRIERNPKAYPNSEKGAKALGEQLYLAIKMKKETE